MGCKQEHALRQTGTLPAELPGHAPQTPEHLQRCAHSSHACGGTPCHGTSHSHRKHEEALYILTQNLRVKNARGRTEYKHGKSAPREQKQKRGRTRAGTNTQARKETRNNAVSGKGPEDREGVGKRPYRCIYPSALCVVSQLQIGNTCRQGKNGPLKIKMQEKRNEVNNTSSSGLRAAPRRDAQKAYIWRLALGDLAASTVSRGAGSRRRGGCSPEGHTYHELTMYQVMCQALDSTVSSNPPDSPFNR